MQISKDRLKEIIKQEIMNLELKESIDVEENILKESTIDTDDGNIVDGGLHQAVERIPALKRGMPKIDNVSELSDAVETLINVWARSRKLSVDKQLLTMVRTAVTNAIKQMDRAAEEAPAMTAAPEAG